MHAVDSVTIVDLRVPECSEGTSNLGALTQTTHLSKASLVVSAVDGPVTGIGVSAAFGRTQSRCQHRFIYIGLDSVLRHIAISAIFQPYNSNLSKRIYRKPIVITTHSLKL